MMILDLEILIIMWIVSTISLDMILFKNIKCNKKIFLIFYHSSSTNASMKINSNSYKQIKQYN